MSLPSTDMTRIRPENVQRKEPQSCPKMDAIRKKEARTKDNMVKTVVAELQDMGLSWGEAQAAVKDRTLWRNVVVAL